MDVVIIGASAVGGITAKECASLGLETIMLEEHKIPGKMHKCSGVVSTKGLDSLGVDYSKSVLNEINGARIHFGKNFFDVKRKNVALVINRQAFDEECVREAVEAGASLKTSFRASSFIEEKKVIVSNGVEEYCADVVVGCDGASSSTASLNDFPRIDLKDFVLCFEGEFPGVDVRSVDEVDVFLDNKAFPGFFGWSIPVNDNTIRVGFGCSDFTKINLLKKSFLKQRDLLEVEPVRAFHHLIPLRTRSKTQKGRILLAGDAAGQVKSTTGGGIVFGGNCGRTAANCVKRFLDGGSLNYEEEWRRKYFSALRTHDLLRRFLNVVPSEVASVGLRASSFLGLPWFLSSFGDMDSIIK
ncbi:MAG: NAD(P)/FAD-dependent oxidoreductase [Candidatus Micrarchaeota archaeon]